MSKRYFLIIFIYFLSLFASPFGASLVHSLIISTNIASGDAAKSYAIVLWTMISNLITLLLIWLILRKQPETNKIIQGKKTSPEISILIVIGGMFALILAQAICVLIISLIVGPVSVSENTKTLVNYASQAPIFLIFISILGPILEELVFRKVIYGGFANHINIHAAAIISSFIFALLHGDIQYLLSYFVVGLILCYLYTKTKRISVSMCAHVLMNTFVLISSLNMLGGS